MREQSDYFRQGNEGRLLWGAAFHRDLNEKKQPIWWRYGGNVSYWWSLGKRQQWTHHSQRTEVAGAQKEQGQRDMDGGWITDSLVESAVKGCVLVSHGRHHKWPQSGWLQATAHFSLTVLEAWKPRPGFHQDWFPLWALGESLFSASLLASGGSYNPWPSLASDTSPNLCPCLPITSCSMSEGLKISSAFLFKRIPVIGFGVYPESKMISSWDSYLITSTKIFFPSKVIFTGCGNQNTYCLLNGGEGHYSTRCRDPVEDSNRNSTWPGMF